MVQAWIYDEQPGVDQREPHQHTPSIDVPLSTLAAVGVLHWKIDPTGCEQDAHKGELGRVRKERHYMGHDCITVSPDKLPEYETKIKRFFEEHIHEDEEIRFVLEGQGYFDVRNDVDAKWIRILVKQGDMIVLPAGMYHRFTLDTQNYIKVIRLFQDQPCWEAINRGDKAEGTNARGKYKQFANDIAVPLEKLYVTAPAVPAAAAAGALSSTHYVGSNNGESWTLNESGAASIANYPHMRAYGGLLYVSGISSRRADNTHVGAEKQADGSFKLDVAEQTSAVLRNIDSVLAQAGASLANVLDATVFLVDIPRDYAAMNKAYNAVFTNPQAAPTRTTVAVAQLPHPNLLIEIKVVARDPRPAALRA